VSRSGSISLLAGFLTQLLLSAFYYFYLVPNGPNFAVQARFELYLISPGLTLESVMLEIARGNPAGLWLGALLGFVLNCFITSGVIFLLIRIFRSLRKN
jgi:hypothetical protein